MENNKLKTNFDKIEYLIGYELPMGFKIIYENHNNVVNGIQFLTLEDIIDELNKGINNNVEDSFLESIPLNSIRKISSSYKRVPFITDYSGNYIGIDFFPDTDGIVGQIINYGCDETKMHVFANTFMDFINGLSTIKFDNNTYITDYLIKNDINFIKDVYPSDIPLKINNIPLNENQMIVEIENEKVYEYSKDTIFSSDLLKDLFSIIESATNRIKYNFNIIGFNQLFNDYRIKNYKDSLSRTMLDRKSFWSKLDNYPKDEIKGYSFNMRYEIIEKQGGNTIKKGKESIYIDIDCNNKVIVRYKETIGNSELKNAYKEICSFIDKL